MGMKSLLLFAFCAVAFAAVAEGLTCYGGTTGSMVQVPCPVGSCANATDSGTWYYTCFPTHEPTGCQTIQQHNVCFCNTDLCNYAGTRSFESIFINILKSGYYKNNNKLTVV